MYTSKPAFTMIELIFVIVIIGILAAIAVPKLLATRSDAKVATMVMKIGNAIEEISNYTNSQKGALSNLTKMSNSLAEMASANEANCSSANICLIKMDGVNCVKLAIIHTSTNDDLNISLFNTTNKLCIYLQEKVKPMLYEARLRGTMVNP